MRRILTRAVLALALALTGTVTGVEVASPATPAEAAVTSTEAAVTSAEAVAASGDVAVAPARGGVAAAIDGPITRSQIIERAQSWVEDPPGPFSRTGFSPDRQNSRAYRRDCAGFVDMAWHLGADHWTGTLPTVSTPISRSELAAGDILLDAEGHVILFHRWEPDRVHFSYYSFGSTSPRHVRHASIVQETFDGRPNGDFRARRYKRVVEDIEPPASSAPPSAAPTSPSGSAAPSRVPGTGRRR
jgi:hypothetical protein